MSLTQLIEQSTSQEIFNLMATQLMEYTGAGSSYCDGSRFCVIGSFMSSIELNSIIDKGLNYVSWDEVVDTGLFPPRHNDLLVELQNINDDITARYHRLMELIKLANRYGLNTKALRPWLDQQLLGTSNEYPHDINDHIGRESNTLLPTR